jgi:hypothetical protein
MFGLACHIGHVGRPGLAGVLPGSLYHFMNRSLGEGGRAPANTSLIESVRDLSVGVSQFPYRFEAVKISVEDGLRFRAAQSRRPKSFDRRSQKILGKLRVHHACRAPIRSRTRLRTVPLSKAALLGKAQAFPEIRLTGQMNIEERVVSLPERATMDSGPGSVGHAPSSWNPAVDGPGREIILPSSNEPNR